MGDTVHPLALAEGLLTQGPPTPPLLPLGGTWLPSERRKGRRYRKPGAKRDGQKTDERFRTGSRAGRGKKTGRQEERGGDGGGGGAAHLQIKFVIQASDGPTARD